MRIHGILKSGAIFLALAACSEPAAAPDDAQTAPLEEQAGDAVASASDTEVVDLSIAPSGSYRNDPRHAYIVFTYSHMGMSHPHVRWRNWTGELDWDAEDPAASTILVTIDAASVDSGVDEFDGHLKGDNFFDVENYSEITFESTSIELTGPNSGKITGDLTIKAVTLPVVLDAVINGANDDAQSKVYKLGFSAATTVKRSDFGVDAYVPYVSDEIEITIESEFVMPYDEE
jgi:polyisoprenoid-binding protein YceI